MSMKRPPSKRQSGRSPHAMLGRATWILVALGRHFGDDDAKITADVRKAMRDALDDVGPFTITYEATDGSIDEGKPPAGVLRHAIDDFGLDTTNPYERDIWSGVVERALSDALAHKGSFDNLPSED